MDNKLSTIQTHLEFLGYEIDEKEDHLLAVSNRNLIWISELSYAILHKTYWTMKKELDDNFYKILNILNQNATISTYRVWGDEHHTLVVEALYSGEYSKVSYGKFLDAFTVDNNEKIYNNDELSEYLE